MAKARPRKDFFNKVELKERGWSERMVLEILKEPDETRENPKYRSGSPTQLFLCDRVKQAEESEQFKEEIKIVERRRATGKAAANKRREQTLAEVDAIPIVVPQIDAGVLIENACDNYNDYKSFCREYGYDYEFAPASPSSDEAFLQRICVNYLRHRCTEYEQRLEETYRKIGAVDAKRRIRERIYRAIAAAYPAFAEECKQQMERRGLRDAEVSSSESGESFGTDADKLEL